MYKKIPNGTTEVIYDLYECQIPPVGYGIHSVTGELVETDIIKRSTKKSEQYWQRTPLPENWDKKRKREIEAQASDPDFVDWELENFREQEWKRRLCGVWFYNNGNPVYLTGEYYMYLNWWKLDDGYPQYRDPDRKRYNVLQYCIEDPRCAGMVEASNRRSGKSYRGGLFVYEYISRNSDTNGGIQSKTDTDAKNLFKGKLVTPFKRLPDFFRPGTDTMAGTGFEKEIKFTTTAKKGKGAMDNFDDLGLNSMINYQPSEVFSYDGWKLHRYLGDEVGKTGRVDVYERHQVVKYCLRVGGNWIGKALYTTTVEKLKGEESITKAFKKLWMDSDPRERDENGHTKSGLYKYFTPAYDMYKFDKYGYPLSEEGKVFYTNTRNALKGDSKAYASEVCKNPFTEKELFWEDGDNCLFDSIRINEQLEFLQWNQDVVEKGNFVWENGIQDSKVIWEKNRNGKWLMPRGFLMKKEDTNLFELRGGIKFPMNDHRFGSACDPYRANMTQDNRRSMGTSLVKQKNNLSDHEDLFINSYVARYYARPATAEMLYEDMLMQSVYFGCKILIENNVGSGPFDYFRRRGYGAYLMHLPGYKEPGVPSTQQNKLSAFYFLEAMISENCNKILYPDLLEDLLEFTLDDTKKFDLSMAALWTELACANIKVNSQNAGQLKKLTDYFPKFKTA